MKSVRPLFDVHCHITHNDFSASMRPEIIREAYEAGVEQMVVVALNEKQLDDALDLQDQFGKERIKIAASTPPHDVLSDEDSFFYEVKKQAVEHRLVAIGETGLEYFYCKETERFQKNILRKYIDLSLECDLPIAIHCRDAFTDLLSILSDYRKEGKKIKGMIHCFTGSMKEAEALLDFGLYLSFSGIITFPKSKELQEVAQRIPLNRMLVETDAPYLAPKPKRGQENRPAYLVYTVEFLAMLLDLPYEAVADATYNNAKQLFSYEK